MSYAYLPSNDWWHTNTQNQPPRVRHILAKKSCDTRRLCVVHAMETRRALRPRAKPLIVVVTKCNTNKFSRDAKNIHNTRKRKKSRRGKKRIQINHFRMNCRLDRTNVLYTYLAISHGLGMSKIQVCTCGSRLDA